MPTLYTIGHSSHSLQDFLIILKTYHITHLVDVRTIPKSRHVPWFNQKKLQKSLLNNRITYIHMPKLGGLRRTNKNSINTAWHNASFRGYADYMQTSEFYAGIKKLFSLMNRKRKIVIMCAEALPWRCHRSLIADAAIIRGINVLDIMSRTSLHIHLLTPFAKVDRRKRPMKVFYPGT